MARYFVCIFLFGFIFSCKKNDERTPHKVLEKSYFDIRSEPVPQLNILSQAPSCIPTYGYLDSYNYSDPCVSPLDKFRFCFIRTKNNVQTLDDADLLTYDFKTNTSKLLASHVKLAADWSVKDWIIFTSSGTSSKLWKIKSNGDSLTMLVDGNSPQEPKWSPDGSKFVYFCKVCNVNKVATENGTLIKALKSFAFASGWKSNTEVLCYVKRDVYQDFFEYNFVTDSSKLLRSASYRGDNTWKFDKTDEQLLECSNALYKAPLNNSGGTFVKPFSTLATKSHDNYNRSPNFAGDRIISQNVTSEKLQNETCKYNYHSYITVMNLDGSNERRINIPE